MSNAPALNLDITINYQQFALAIKQNIPLVGITGIFGHSASGKSTLLRAIAGLEKNISGNITLSDNNINSRLTNTLVDSAQKKFIKPEQRHIGLVFQNARLFPHLTVLGNLTFAAKRCKQKRLNLEEVIQLTELTPLLDHPVEVLSGGQQQRVALARALLAEPTLLLLDEPLSALDQASKSHLLHIILNIQKKLSLPMLYVSHSLDELQQVCDNLLVLAQGQVVNFGNIHQIIHQLTSPISPEAKTHIASPIIHQQTSLSLAIKQRDNGHGLMSLAVGEQVIYRATDPNLATTEPLRCFILASDISISLTEPKNSSIVNHLFGHIKQISLQKNNVLVTVACGSQDFFVTISAFSQHKLGLRIEQAVYLQFKASAVRTFIH